MRTLDEDTKAWLAIRKEAAKTIDPATAEVTWWHRQVVDPYGILHRYSGGGRLRRPELLRARARFGRVGFV